VFCNVCVCGCGWFGNMYTVLCLRFFLTWLRFFLPWQIFPCFFLSCKANARVKLAKTGHGPHSSTLVVICVVRLLFVLFYVLFVCKCVLPPGDNPIAVKYIISCHIIYHIINSNSRTANYQCSLLSNKSPVIRIVWMSGSLAVPINPDKWSSTAFCTLVRSLKGSCGNQGKASILLDVSLGQPQQ